MINDEALRYRLVHPIVVGALVVLVVNDHVLKGFWPSWLTGKLSDVAGLVFFPILLAALAEIALPRLRERRRWLMAVSVTTTAIMFTAIQLFEPATDAYRLVGGVLFVPFRALFGTGARLIPVQVTPDPTDLLALPMVFLSWRLATGPRHRPQTASELEPAITERA